MVLQFDRLVDESSKAICLMFDWRVVWVPRSCCEEPDLNERTIEVKGWFVIERGLEGYEV